MSNTRDHNVISLIIMSWLYVNAAIVIKSSLLIYVLIKWSYVYKFPARKLGLSYLSTI